MSDPIYHDVSPATLLVSEPPANLLGVGIMRLHFALLTAFALHAFAVPSASSHYTVHEKRDIPLKKWDKREALQPQGLLPMRIGLTQGNLDKGHAMLMEMYVATRLVTQIREMPPFLPCLFFRSVLEPSIADCHDLAWISSQHQSYLWLKD